MTPKCRGFAPLWKGEPAAGPQSHRPRVGAFDSGGFAEMHDIAFEQRPAPAFEGRRAFLRLTPAERDILVAAGLLGSRFSISQLRRVTRAPKSAVLHALQRAHESDLLRNSGEDDTVVFRKGARAVVRRFALEPFARSLHARIARDLERHGADSARIADHWRAAGQPAHVTRHFEIAAEAAFNAGRYGLAARHFHDAIAATPEGSDNVRLHRWLARSVSRAGRPEQAIHILRERAAALEGLPEKRYLADTLLDLSRALWTVCESDEAVVVGERILELADVPETITDEARLWLAFGHAVADRVGRAETLLAPLRARPSRLSPSLLLPLAEVEITIAAKRGDVASALRFYAGARRVERHASLVASRALYNNFLFAAGPLTEAPEIDDAIARTLAGGDGSDRPSLLLQLHLTLTDLALLRGRIVEAGEQFRPATNRDNAGPRYRALEQAYALTLASLRDERTDTATLVEPRLIEAILRSREARTIATVVVPQCEALLQLHRGGEAQELLERALAAASGCDVPFRLELLAARIGTTAALNAARRKLRSAIELRKDRLADASLALFDAIVATRVGNRSARYAHAASEAAEIFKRAGWRLHQAESLEYAGRTADAADVYRAAGAVCELRRLRLPTRRTAIRRDLPLSQRQRQVCALARGGASNAAIAERLGLREKTVAHHLSIAYARLGIRSRWQLEGVSDAPPVAERSFLPQ